MKDLEEIQGRCVITEDGHWLWDGAVREDGRAWIYAPDYTRSKGKMQSQNGHRAVWHVINCKAIPKGRRVIGTCEETACVAPGHGKLVTEAQYGAFMRKTGRFKNSTKRMLANRAIGRKRSDLTLELIEYIQTSPKTGRDLAIELDLLETVVSRARRGEMVAFQPASPFVGMVRGLGA